MLPVINNKHTQTNMKILLSVALLLVVANCGTPLILTCGGCTEPCNEGNKCYQIRGPNNFRL